MRQFRREKKDLGNILTDYFKHRFGLNVHTNIVMFNKFVLTS